MTTEEDGRTLNFLAVILLLLPAMAFGRKQGSDALEEKLIEAGVTEIVNPQRTSVV